VRSRSELKEFLDDQQQRFIEDFEALLKIAYTGDHEQMKGHLESLWARYNALLALAERFACRADAAAEEMCRIVISEVDKSIKR
jgi:hypothetical protein